LKTINSSPASQDTTVPTNQNTIGNTNAPIAPIELISSSADNQTGYGQANTNTDKIIVANLDEDELPNQHALGVEDLIAELRLLAPSENIKFCLRNYQYNGKSTEAITKDIQNGSSRPTLIETAKFLQIKFNESTAVKKTLAHNILCRIQNLLPDDCNLCNKHYRIGLNETPLLECSICLQGIHTRVLDANYTCKSKLRHLTPSRPYYRYKTD
jgi:hypothetical protein